MWKQCAAVLGGLVAVAVCVPRAARALPVEYRIAGRLTGAESIFVFDPVRVEDVSFQISILADAQTAFEFGSLPGLGRAFVNASGSARWSVDGFGTAVSDRVQVFAIPGVARVGFGWDGEVFPLDTDQPAHPVFQFANSAFATNPGYGHLDAVVPAVPLTLLTELRNPPNVRPTFTTSIQFLDQRSLYFEELTDLSYSVVAIPEPSTAALFVLGLGAVSAARWRRRGAGSSSEKSLGDLAARPPGPASSAGPARRAR